RASTAIRIMAPGVTVMVDSAPSFEGHRVLIIGDAMLDEYLSGDCSRLSPEAPVPVLRVSGSRLVLGGAANSAANVASLGGQPVWARGLGGADPRSRRGCRGGGACPPSPAGGHRFRGPARRPANPQEDARRGAAPAARPARLRGRVAHRILDGETGDRAVR